MALPCAPELTGTSQSEVRSVKFSHDGELERIILCAISECDYALAGLHLAVVEHTDFTTIYDFASQCQRSQSIGYFGASISHHHFWLTRL